MRFEHQTAVVTGGAGGFGAAHGQALAQEGARVVLADVDKARVEATAARINQELGQDLVLAQLCDVTRADQVDRLMEAALERFGSLDILINNAGGSLGTPKAEVDQVEEDDWDLVLGVNLKGAFLCTRAASRVMKKAGRGRIVNTSSVAARMGGRITSVHYVAAKGGVMAFTRQAALELGPFGITVNAVAPAVVLTGERLQKLWQENRTEEQRQAHLENIPLRRLATVQEVTRAVLFLCSDDASYINGTTLDINGGIFSV